MAWSYIAWKDFSCTRTFGCVIKVADSLRKTGNEEGLYNQIMD
jgi:hypothetical protein